METRIPPSYTENSLFFWSMMKTKQTSKNETSLEINQDLIKLFNPALEVFVNQAWPLAPRAATVLQARHFDQAGQGVKAWKIHRFFWEQPKPERTGKFKTILQKFLQTLVKCIIQKYKKHKKMQVLSNHFLCLAVLVVKIILRCWALGSFRQFGGKEALWGAYHNFDL